MATSKITICNLALAMLGADSIRSFDENNKRAKMAEVFFEPASKSLLAAFDWTFARKFAGLQQLTAETEAAPDGLYVYGLPPDCETVRDLWPRGSKEWWEVNGKTLLCKNPSEAYIYYTATITDSSMFSSTYTMLLATLLATKMCLPITQDKDMARALAQQLELQTKEIWSSDANIGNDHRAYDEDPQNDSFVNPDGVSEVWDGRS